MKKLLMFATVALFTLVCTSMAFDTNPLAGTSGNTTYSQSQTDVFGDIMGTIPNPSPGASNAWVGLAWANGYLYEFKNVVSAPAQMLQLNPATGAVMNTYTIATGASGYVMGGTYDPTGTPGFWVAQWNPTNTIWKFGMTGATITSFVPTTGGYSARCPNFDGTNLWVGCNLASANTKLIKMTTAGVNIQEWMTGTAVGWYMGGEFSTNAPANANLYVVDNVGNTIKRLAGLNTLTITAAATVASPATGDYAEGLTFDGDLLWHNAANSLAGVIWKLDDGYPGVLPALNVTLTPIGAPIVIPATGGSFNFNASVVNAGPAATFTVWGRIKNPDGSYTAPNLGPVVINPPVGVTVTRTRTQNVPAGWAAGMYYTLAYGAMSVTYPAIDKDSFSWTKSATGNGPLVWDATCSGELFPGEVPVSAPSSFTVAGASPNPFNPTTTISFTLPEMAKVTLNVFDVSGRQVAQVVNGLREAGTHQVTFDGSNLASGVYLYTITASNHTATGKMVLMK